MDTKINYDRDIDLQKKAILDKEAVRSIQGQQISDQGWINRGIVDVPVGDLPLPEGVDRIEDFNHHISWEDAKSATERLPAIQEQVRAGKSGDDFSVEDNANGLDWQNGKRRIFDLYYGSDPVVLDKIGDQYTIVSGRHRIYAAKELGLQTIPARLHEKLSE